jgi:hypothetical protein
MPTAPTSVVSLLGPRGAIGCHPVRRRESSALSFPMTRTSATASWAVGPSRRRWPIWSPDAAHLQPRMRLYLLDFPGGSSARILASAFVAPEASFETALEEAPRILDSFEFHTG